MQSVSKDRSRLWSSILFIITATHRDSAPTQRAAAGQVRAVATFHRGRYNTRGKVIACAFIAVMLVGAADFAILFEGATAPAMAQVSSASTAALQFGQMFFSEGVTVAVDDTWNVIFAAMGIGGNTQAQQLQAIQQSLQTLINQNNEEIQLLIGVLNSEQQEKWTTAAQSPNAGMTGINTELTNINSWLNNNEKPTATQASDSLNALSETYFNDLATVNDGSTGAIATFLQQNQYLVNVSNGSIF